MGNHKKTPPDGPRGQETAGASMTPAEIAAAADDLEGAIPEVILRWAAERFPGRVGFATAFGLEGSVLVDVIGRERLPIDIYTLDTGLLFPEALALWGELERRYGVRIRPVQPALAHPERETNPVPGLWQRAPVEAAPADPQRAEILLFDAWVTAVRRDQRPEHVLVRVVEPDARLGLVKVNPLAAWTSAQIRERVRARKIPVNPLNGNGVLIPCLPPPSAAASRSERPGVWRRRFKPREES
jgi:3'-phosphoadenosine 5'-phosphosulfate sulfotransferase (PAPS reductase)/FAD synthetase